MPIPTTPIALTRPASGQSYTFFEAIGTKTGFIAGWNKVAGFNTEVQYQRFSANGAPIGKAVTVEGPGFLEGLPEFVELGGDKYGMVWKTANPITLESTVIDAATGKSSPSTVITDKFPASFIHDLAPLPGGKVALVTRSAATGGEDTTLFILDKSMKPVGKPVVIEDDVAGPFGAATYEQTVVSNGKGGVAIFRAADSQLKAVNFDANGKAGATFKINSVEMRSLDLFSLARFSVKAEELDTGGYVVTWTTLDKGQNINFDVHARVYGENGAALSKEFSVNTDLGGNQTAPEVLSFEKCFAIAWSEEFSPLAPFRETQSIRFFDKKGVAISDDIVTEYFGSDGAGLASPSDDTEYARLPDGSYVKIFTANGLVYADGVPAPKVGTARSEQIAGKNPGEIILGAGGNDTLNGGAGADTLDGGAGVDRLIGGEGADMLIGAAGNDVLYGGGKGDVFVFRPKGGADKVMDFDRLDRLDVSAFHYDDAEDALADARQVGADVQIRLFDDDGGGSAVVTLVGRKLAFLGVDDFIV
ncbi:calcium-binding protein [Hansschlegelia sp. KR7-227]|uniref:calcium-binding protein n=1 Tax=Hansschlegelia sp. KR7-227 TaxID=3400914 RepID=UPI003C061970